jgi:glycine amidinotransferase
LTDKEPLFDAADAARFGKDIFWQASSVSNGPGLDWVTRHFAQRGIRVHVVQFSTGREAYHPWHIDVDLLPLRPGLAVYNPVLEPITPELWKLFEINDWELIPAARPTREYDCKITMVGEMRGPSWISMNTLSLDPNTICVEAGETGYMEQLDKLGFNVVPVPFADVVPFGGALHCATVDVYREGDCEDYFPKQIPGF